MHQPSPIGREKHCTCAYDANGELLPSGCPEHSTENARMDHRHGKQWRDMDGNRVETVCPVWVEWLVLGASVATIVGLGAWAVWG